MWVVGGKNPHTKRQKENSGMIQIAKKYKQIWKQCLLIYVFNLSTWTLFSVTDNGVNNIKYYNSRSKCINNHKKCVYQGNIVQQLETLEERDPTVFWTLQANYLIHWVILIDNSESSILQIYSMDLRACQGNLLTQSSFGVEWVKYWPSTNNLHNIQRVTKCLFSDERLTP